jgi:hypothetical protein
MKSIPRQLATFAAVLAVLYVLGFIAGLLIDEESHGESEGHGRATLTATVT